MIVNNFFYGRYRIIKLSCLLAMVFLYTISGSSQNFEEINFWDDDIKNCQARIKYYKQKVVFYDNYTDEKLQELNEKTRQARMELHQIQFLVMVNFNNPFEQQLLLQQFTQLYHSFDDSLDVISDIKDEYADAKRTVSQMKIRLKKLALEDQEYLTPDLIDVIERFFTDIDLLENSINLELQKMEVELKPIYHLQKELKKYMKRIETRLPLILKRLIMRRVAPIWSAEMWETCSTELQLNLHTLPFLCFRILPNSLWIWCLLIGSVAIATCLYYYCKAFINTWLIKKFPHLEIIKPDIMKAAFGLTFYISIELSSFFMDFPHSLFYHRIAVAFMYYALICGSWAIKLALKNVTTEHRNPVNILFAYFVFMYLYQAFRFDYFLMLFIWPVLSVSLLVFMIKQAKNKYPLLETFIIHCSILTCIAMITIASCGYVYLAIFIFMLWVVTTVLFQVGFSVSLLLRQFIASSPQSGIRKLWRVFVVGFGIPCIWVVSMGLFIMWISSRFGVDSNYILNFLDFRFEFYKVSFNMFDLATVIFLFFCVKTTLNIVNTYLGIYSEKEAGNSRNLLPSLKTLFFYTSWTLYILISFQIIGISITSIVVVLGGLSFGIGFGLQNIVNNFISGLIIQIGRILKPGDIIQVDKMYATVLRVNIRSTLVSTFDNAIITVPNSELISKKLTNLTMNDEKLRCEIVVKAAIKSDIKQAEKIMLKVPEGFPEVEKQSIDVLYHNISDDDCIQFIVVVWINNIKKYKKILSNIRKEIYTQFVEYGINFPTPQLELSVNKPEENKQPSTEICV